MRKGTLQLKLHPYSKINHSFTYHIYSTTSLIRHVVKWFVLKTLYLTVATSTGLKWHLLI